MDAAKPLLENVLSEKDLEGLVARLARLDSTEVALAAHQRNADELRSQLSAAQKELTAAHKRLDEHRSQLAKAESNLRAVEEISGPLRTCFSRQNRLTRRPHRQLC